MSKAKNRRIIFTALAIVFLAVFIIANPDNYSDTPKGNPVTYSVDDESLAINALEKLEVKGRAPKTGYEREEFGNGWGKISGCDARNVILKRDLSQTTLEDCLVMKGQLKDPYTGDVITFERGKNSNDVQIDHVVALSDAWQKGAQQLDKEERVKFANDPMNLLAVSGVANQQKKDGDAASWLPKNKAFRCEYVARQVSVKYKYGLWVTQAEKDSIIKILGECPTQETLR